MKVLKQFYSNSRKKNYTPGEYNEEPLSEWVDEGLVEKKKTEPKKKEEVKEVEKKDAKPASKRKTKVKPKSESK